MNTSLMIHPTEFDKFSKIFSEIVNANLKGNIQAAYEKLNTKIPLPNFIDYKDGVINQTAHYLIYAADTLPDSVIKIPKEIIEFINDCLLETTNKMK